MLGERKRRKSEEARDVLWSVQQLDAATQTQFADVLVESGNHTNLRTAAYPAMRASGWRAGQRAEPLARGSTRFECTLYDITDRHHTERDHQEDNRCLSRKCPRDASDDEADRYS